MVATTTSPHNTVIGAAVGADAVDDADAADTAVYAKLVKGDVTNHMRVRGCTA